MADKSDKEKNRLTENEKKAYRALVGQLNWVATHTRPDAAFETCASSNSQVEATLDDLIRLNKLIERVKKENVNLFFPRLRNLSKCSLECYTEAAFKNLQNGKSQETQGLVEGAEYGVYLARIMKLPSNYRPVQVVS